MFMKCVAGSLSGVEGEVLRSILQGAGIPSLIRHTDRAGLPGVTPFESELWVENDADYPIAHELVEEWSEPVPERVAVWTCPGCGQRLAGEFDSCWKCGARRPAAR
jgi:hypothetical protein